MPEIPLPRTLLYLYHCSLPRSLSGFLCFGRGTVRKTLSGWEFGWGGTSVKRQRRGPKVSSMRTESSCRLTGEMLNFSMHTNCASMAYQSSRLKGVQLEASDIDELYEQKPHVD